MAGETIDKSDTVAAELPLTQRAYTLRLRGVDENDQSWRDALWETHEAVNKGAKAFGDWLLTLRGGLSHELVEPPPPPKGKKRTEEETNALRRNRRILLALSWLSVEDQRGAPTEHRVASAADSSAGREQKLVDALRAILQARGLPVTDIEAWIADCRASLAARIRDDAVWINRSALFDERARSLKGLDRNYATQTILTFFGPADEYLSLPSTGSDDEVSASGGSDGPEFRTLARQWVSTNFGTGKKSDTGQISSALRQLAEADLNSFDGKSKIELLKHLNALLNADIGDDPEESLRIAVGWTTGRQSAGRLAISNLPDRVTKGAIETLQAKFAEEARKKSSAARGRTVPPWMPDFQKEIEQAIGMDFVIVRNLIGEYSVMLDHAARRVSIGHSWIKLAEAQRQRFTADAAKLESVPQAARQWLDQFCNDRGERTGAIDGYRIRPRAIQGWETVVKQWGSLERSSQKAREELAADVPEEVADGSQRTLNERARIAAAREVQSDPDVEKIGDIQLFEALAADEAVCVWKPEGRPDSQPLVAYVAAMHARNRQQRFKVPAYRHPDPLRHPVFCDFGNSRWEIKFAVHQAVERLDKVRQRREKREGALRKAQAAFEKAKSAAQQDKARRALEKAQRQLAETREEEAWLSRRHALTMSLWNGANVSPVQMHWSSKRLTADLALDDFGRSDTTTFVTRADRLGRAAACANGAVSIFNVFEEGDWNGRLQAPRAQLDRIAALQERGKTAQAESLRRHVRWLVTFSPRLRPSGPFIRYAAKHKIKPNRKGEYYPFSDKNKAENRQRHAKLILSRLPGLRVLSVDLGHRYAAACAVWEALSRPSFLSEIEGREIVAGGTSDADLYCHTRHTDDRGKTRITIYRRIGEDFLRDPKTGQIIKTPHPAPWARLDRQFVIKLQGEEKPARAASKGTLKNGSRSDVNEVAMVNRLAQDIGLLRDDTDDQRGRGVDELMRRAVRIAMLGLKRHARWAKIAYAFNPDCPGIPGMGGSLTEISKGDDKHIEFIVNALVDWHTLATDANWDSDEARQLWQQHISSVPGGFEIAKPMPSDPADRPTRAEQRESEKKLREKLKPIATYFATAEAEARAIHEAWKELWHTADGIGRTNDDFRHTLIHDDSGKVIGSRTFPKPGMESPGGWHECLRTLTDWIMGRRLDGARSKHWNRHMGGISLTRIATMRSLYQLHKAFAMRPRPDRIQGAPERGESNRGTAQHILDAMERMREQRVKQLASRIVEAALGIGSENREHWKCGRKRPRAVLYSKDGQGNEHLRRFKPCHAIVIESLRNYRPEEINTRRENRALMNWSAGKVRKYLEEACQLYGLHLREIMPNYTSKQCSRTGLPGIRCEDVPVNQETGEPEAYWWKRALNTAKKKVGGEEEKQQKGDAVSRFFVDLADHLEQLKKEGQPLPKFVRLPRNGGDLFVAASPLSCAAKDHRPCALCNPSRSLQADLNAAANIGLRALLDPDFTGKWWYVPAVIDNAGWRVPAPKSCAGAVCLSGWKVAPQGDYLTADREPIIAANKTASQKEIVNLWQDPSAIPSAGQWRETAAYWNIVRGRVVKQLRLLAGITK